MMRAWLLALLLLPTAAMAQKRVVPINGADEAAGLSAQAIAPAIINASTVTITQNSVSTVTHQSAPLQIGGNTNTYLQAVIQNRSNGVSASGNYVITADLGSDTSYYAEIGINSSKFANTSVSAEVSSSAYVTSSDSDLVLWANTNGGVNSAANGHIIMGSSTPYNTNTAVDISSKNVLVNAVVNLSTSSKLAVGSSAAPCSTCTIHLIAPVGSGLAINGNVEVSSQVILGTTIGAGVQLFYCSGGTFTGNICRGAACICTGGTATALSIYVK